ncbi:MAG: polysaccharide biosynthesis protein, partial [Clostridia bacterium]|nr:polysaccharide biosynthesis protein [Clostridia bacterium]
MNVKKSQHQSFLHGALILTISMIIVKVIGAVFKIPLNAVITEDGMGYFNTAYAFYSPLYALATAGFPIAIARLVSENYTLGRYRDVRTIRRAATRIFLITGSVGTLVMWIGAGPFLAIANNDGAFPAMLMLAPAILFSCLNSIYRGYYNGLRNMYPTAISEVVEAAVKLLIGLTGAWLTVSVALMEYERAGTVFGGVVASVDHAKAAALPYAAAAAIFGVSLGSVLSFVALLIYHKIKGDDISNKELHYAPPSHTMHYTVVKLIKVAIPVGIGALAVNIASALDALFLQSRMSDIVATHADVLLEMYEGMITTVTLQNPQERLSNYLYGCYGNALTVFMLVPAITQAFGTSALPNVTEAWTRGDKKEIKSSIESVVRITALVSIPAGLGIATLADPITRILFSGSTGAPITARVLIVLGLAAIFASLSTPIISMLQAVGRVDLPVKIMVISLSIKVLLNFTLAGIPQVNVIGGGVGTLVCYLLEVVLSLIALAKVTKVSISMTTTFIKPGIAAILCCITAFLVHALLDIFLPNVI